MPFRDAHTSLHGIADAILLIEQFTAGMDFDAFREDPKTIAAVERKLLIISEAAGRLGDEAKILCPGMPWRDIRGIGNWLRHQYDSVELPVIWKTVRGDLPLLKAAVLHALAPPPPNPERPQLG
ncbi:MAG: HepT-like ribonuclease domain-containing protein [Candidatus Sulfotelmatobacter sp.]